MITTYNPYEPRYANQDTYSTDVYIQWTDSEYWKIPSYDEPDVILKNKGPELEPKPTWKTTPAKSITIRPEMRIKQPVARAGYRRGNRVCQK